jgi:hypothetical protein
MGPKSFSLTSEEEMRTDLSPDTLKSIETIKQAGDFAEITPYIVECLEFTPSLSLSSSGSSNQSWFSQSKLSSTQDSASPEPAIMDPMQHIGDTDASLWTVSLYEKNMFYLGIGPTGYQPELLFRSDLLTNPFVKPGSHPGHPYVPTKALRGVHGTPLNKIWKTLGPQIRDLIIAHLVQWCSINPARFITYGKDEVGILGPVVIWIAVYPSSTTPATAKIVSDEIISLLRENGIEGVVIEWCEATLAKLAGPLPSLLPTVEIEDITAQFRRRFTSLINVPLTTQESQDIDKQGSLTLFFHEGKDERGNISDKVLGLTNCHVLRKDTTVDYDHRTSDSTKLVRLHGARSFQAIIDDIVNLGKDHLLEYQNLQTIIEFEKANNHPDQEKIEALKKSTEKHTQAISTLDPFLLKLREEWGGIESRNIGHVYYAKSIGVDVYTEDWAVFEVDKDRVKPRFEGTAVDLGVLEQNFF